MPFEKRLCRNATSRTMDQEKGMIDFERWERRRLVLDNIRLDRRNPRLNDSARELNQPELRQILVEKADVRDIASRIKRYGYFPMNPPIVVQEGRHFIVIEGNRRIAALQILRNPDLAPVSSRRFFTGLAAEVDTSKFEKIEVLIAPSREIAAPVLYTIHASEAARSWGRLMKHRFIAGEVAKGASLSVVAAKFGVTESEVQEAATEIMLLNLVESLDLTVDEKERILSEDFPLSTLNRVIISTKAFGELTGFSVNGASFSTSIPEDQFRKVITSIFRDLANNEQNSRTLHDETSRRAYIIKIAEQHIDSSRTGSWRYTPAEDIQAEEPAPPRPQRRRRVQEKLIPLGDQVHTGTPKLDALIEEGQIMPVGTYRNAAALLLRTVLQLAIFQVMTQHGQATRLRTTSGNVKKFTDLIKTFARCQEIPLTPSHRDQLLRFIDDNNPGYLNIRTLHDFVHDPFQQPEKVALQNFWAIIEPIVKLCQQP